MKKVFRFFTLCIFTFFLSGCSVKYEAVIDNTGNVNDTLSIEIPNQLASTYYSTPKEYLENMYKSKSEEYKLSGYDIEYEFLDDTSIATMKGSYRSIETFLNSGIINILYSKKDIKKDGNKIHVKLYGLNDIYNTIGAGDYYDFPEEFTVSINSKYVIEKDNADERNVLTGVYKWHFKRGLIKKTIEFTIVQKSSISANIIGSHPILSIIVLILAIFLILYIIYGVMKGKIEKANSI